MIRFRLAQSSQWVYQCTHYVPLDEPDMQEACALARITAINELKAWIMKLDPEREVLPIVRIELYYDFQRQEHTYTAIYQSQEKLHDSDDHAGEAFYAGETEIPADGEREAGRRSGEDTHNDTGGHLSACDASDQESHYYGADPTR